MSDEEKNSPAAADAASADSEEAATDASVDQSAEASTEASDGAAESAPIVGHAGTAPATGDGDLPQPPPAEANAEIGTETSAETGAEAAVDDSPGETAQPVAAEETASEEQVVASEENGGAENAKAEPDPTAGEEAESVAAAAEETPAESSEALEAGADAVTEATATGDAATEELTTGELTTGESTTGNAATGDAAADAATGDAAAGDAVTGDAATGDAATGDAAAAVGGASVPGSGKPTGGKPATAKKKKAKRKKSAAEERFSRAMAENEVLTGKVIGWNNGGFHVVIEKTTAFCPRSEMESGPTAEPESYLDQELEFCVLRVQDKGRRVVVSRSKLQRREAAARRGELREQLKEGVVLEGTVDSLADFGAFVDLGGLRGLVHVSEISHQRVEKPSDHLEVGQQVEVKVLRIEQGGKRISLSMKQLADNPWDGVKKRFPEGDVVAGVVDHSNPAGAVIELEPGITGFLPRKAMSLPMEAAVPRAFPPGKEVKVQIMSVDPRRQRLSLALEGNTLEGSRSDLAEFRKKASKETGSFNALADALQKARGESTAD